MTFSELNLIQPVLRAITEEGYTTPTPIQEQGIPVMLEGKDLLGVAQTGTGKTCAFAVPILHRMYESRPEGKKRGPIRALILTPTRELAVQVSDSFKTYGKYTGFKTCVIFGGVSQYHQVQALRAYPEIVVATPGRLLDLINQGQVHLDHLEFFVLDEADRMLDMGFIHDVKKILTYVPEERQSVFFSATMPESVAALANRILKDPIEIAVTPVSSTSENIAQSLFYVNKTNKSKLLVHILEDLNIKSALVFTRTKHKAEKVMNDLNMLGIRTDAIHGNKSQNARQQALNNFKKNKIRVLVATDIAARGIDVDNLSHVINFEIPNEPENYVHRIGRTGRAGASGIAISFCEQEEMGYLRSIHKLLPQPIDVVLDHPYAEVMNPRDSSSELGRNGRLANRGGGGGGRNGGGSRGGSRGGSFNRNDRGDRGSDRGGNRGFSSDRREGGSSDRREGGSSDRREGGFSERRESNGGSERESSFRPERKPFAEASGDRREGSSERNDSFSREKRSFGEGSNDRRPSNNGGERRSEGRSFGGDRSNGGGFDARRSSGDSRPSGNGFGERRSESRSFGDSRPSGNGSAERRSEGRPFGDSRPSGNGFGERRSEDRSTGDSRPSGNGFGERRSFGNDSGERRSFGDRNENRGGDRSKDLKDKASRFDRRDKPAGNGGARSSDKPSFERRGPSKDKPFSKKKSW